MKNFVKKKGVLASCLFGLALVACGGEQDTEYHTTYGDPHPEGYYEYVGGGVGDYIDLNARFLEDVDYLFYILENNFPLFNATERVVGIDTQQLMMNTRNYTETSEFATDSNRHIERVLRSNFFIHFNNGHHRNNFGLLEALTQEDFRRHLYNNPREEWLPIIDNPSTRSLFGLVISPFPTGESEWFVAKSIEEGYVAYIGWEQLTEAHTNHQTGNLFGVAMETHGDMILEFLQSIVDYEHLIIDLRTIERARFDYFPEMIIQNLISEPITYDHHFFSMGGEYVRQFYNILPRGQAGFVPVTDELLAGFPYLHPDDAGILRYHYHLERIIHPSANSIGFDGKIWVLINNRNIYDTDHIARVMQQTGLATLVGEPTSGGGITSMFSVPFVLPNTGFAGRFMPLYGVDQLGRNIWEHPTQPDIFNREGMDAMQTVLALIAEGDY